ncbi:MAG: helix-turn-helix transcriptional regulator [Bacteroidetes bacterium]|nr:helix-turn-helix transcriptional regulator [Bacteroidota bacterium]
MAEIEKFHFGNLFRRMLRQKDISVREVAERTGKSTQAVYSFLRTQSPRMDIVLEVAIILGFKDFVNELISNITKLKMSMSYDEKGNYVTRTLEYDDLITFVPDGGYREEHNPEKMENLKEKVLSLEKSLYLAEQVIVAKDELIEHLKIEK